MAISDMFLKLTGVKGESADAAGKHKDEIEVVAWSWDMHRPTDATTHSARGRRTLGELVVIKRADRASTTLMNYLSDNVEIKDAKLTVRKAGKDPLEYFSIMLEKARVTSVKVESLNAELVERVTLGYTKIIIEYVPQSATGAAGGGTSTFEDSTVVPPV